MDENDNPFGIDEYYKNIDYSLWDDIFSTCQEKLENGSQALKKQWTLELYSKYLQVLEILCTNITVVGLDNIENLFISNSDLRENISKIKEDKETIEKFLDRGVFYVKEKDRIKDYEKKKDFYRRILIESLSDYKKDYHFLNAYKHGFRVEVRMGATVAIGKFPTKYNRMLVYFTMERDKETKQKIIFKNNICFNWERILYKSLFVVDMLKKLKISSSLRLGEEVGLETIFILNKEHFEKGYGTFRMKEAFLTSKA